METELHAQYVCAAHAHPGSTASFTFSPWLPAVWQLPRVWWALSCSVKICAQGAFTSVLPIYLVLVVCLIFKVYVCIKAAREQCSLRKLKLSSLELCGVKCKRSLLAVLHPHPPPKPLLGDNPDYKFGVLSFSI